MRASDRTRIQYADKQSGISNAYKKWIGEVRGLKELGRDRNAKGVRSDVSAIGPTGRATRTLVATSLDSLAGIYRRVGALRHRARPLRRVRLQRPGADRASPTASRSWSQDYEKLKAEGKLDGGARTAAAHRKRFLQGLRRGGGQAHLQGPAADLSRASIPRMAPAVPADDGLSATAAMWVRRSMTSMRAASSPRPDEAEALLDGINREGREEACRAIRCSSSRGACFRTFLEQVRPQLVQHQRTHRGGHAQSMCKGMMDLFPEKTYWPDANSTLRLSYGHVEGSEPRDGVDYTPFTTLDGVLEKYEPGDAEFDLPQRLLDLHRRKDYGAVWRERIDAGLLHRQPAHHRRQQRQPGAERTRRAHRPELRSHAGKAP